VIFSKIILNKRSGIYNLFAGRSRNKIKKGEEFRFVSFEKYSEQNWKKVYHSCVISHDSLD